MLDAITSLPLKDPELFRQANCINGQWVQADSGKTLDVRNPSTGELVGQRPGHGHRRDPPRHRGGACAQPGWRAMLAKDRAAILRKLFDLMLANTDDLAAIMTAEQGKPLAESKGEIAYAASFIEWFAEEGKRVYGDTIPQNAKGRRIIVTKEPIGVFAAITPWNFPAAMITRKAGPGWAAGCTGVIRPAQPDAVLRPGDRRAGRARRHAAGRLQRHHRPVRRDRRGADLQPAGAQADLHRLHRSRPQLLAQCAPTIKKTSMELGGNAPFIVFDDADLDAAVEGAMASKYRNTGQTCVCANRMLVQDGVYDAFAAKLKAAVEALKVGDGMEPGVTPGPADQRRRGRRRSRSTSPTHCEGRHDRHRRQAARATAAISSSRRSWRMSRTTR